MCRNTQGGRLAGTIRWTHATDIELRGESQMASNASTSEPNASVVPSREPVLDTQQLLERCLGNLNIAQRAVGRFQAEFPGKLTQLSELVGEGDLEGVRALAHQLKGTTANLSAESLKSCFAELEELCRDGLMEDVRSTVAELEGIWEQFVSAAQELAGNPNA